MLLPAVVHKSLVCFFLSFLFLTSSSTRAVIIQHHDKARGVQTARKCVKLHWNLCFHALQTYTWHIEKGTRSYALNQHYLKLRIVGRGLRYAFFEKAIETNSNAPQENRLDFRFHLTRGGPTRNKQNVDRFYCINNRLIAVANGRRNKRNVYIFIFMHAHNVIPLNLSSKGELSPVFVKWQHLSLSIVTNHKRAFRSLGFDGKTFTHTLNSFQIYDE